MWFFNWIKSLFGKPAPIIQSTKGWDPYWGEILKRLLTNNLDAFNKAGDVTKIRPDWGSLNDDQKVICLIQFFKSLIYFESGYNPLSESVDVGTKYDKQTWSVGLLQLSGVDKSNLGLTVGFDYEDLKNPEKNLIQGIAIMVNQINKRGKIIIPKSEKGNPGVYWATLNPGNKYDKSAPILEAVHKLNFEQEKTPVSELPWRQWFLDRMGWTEKSHDKELSKGWALTKYCKSFKTVIGKEHSWCGMSLATALNSCGYDYPVQCETAFAWKGYGEAIDWKEDGIPKGAIVVLSTSHVTTSNRFHDHREPTIYCLGGNQGDSINVSGYPMKNVVYVGMPVKKA